MSSNNGRSIPIYIYNSGHSRKGHGVGGIFKGWLRRTIPIIKSKYVPLAKSIGKDIAVTVLDSAYTAGRDMLVNKKDPSVYDQGVKEVGNFKFVNPKNASRRPKKIIKRKHPSKSISRIRNAKRKRPNSNSTGFRKITL